MYKNVEEAIGFFYITLKNVDFLFDELKEFCNNGKPNNEHLPNQEIQNILNIFINIINEPLIKIKEIKELKTSNLNINTIDKAYKIINNLILIIASNIK